MDMTNTEQNRIKELMDRLGRISASDEWNGDLNPTQWAALSYLDRANRFSRTPTHVAEYMAATRGTVSQTLKTLARKNLIEEHRSEQDKRSIFYSVTQQGIFQLKRTSFLEETVSNLDKDDSSHLLKGLEALTRTALKKRGFKAFGTCETCCHHEKTSTGGFCRLLNEQLTPPETKQICFEHSEAV